MLYIVWVQSIFTNSQNWWFQNKYLEETYLSWKFEKRLKIFFKQAAAVHRHCWQFPKAKQFSRVPPKRILSNSICDLNISVKCCCFFFTWICKIDIHPCTFQPEISELNKSYFLVSPTRSRVMKCNYNIAEKVKEFEKFCKDEMQLR